MKMDDFTLVILVRDRQHNLPNISEYYKDLSCKKIIFDSSLTPYEPGPLEERGFEYIYFGPMTIWEKRFKVSSMVDTKFILDNPDDDITLKSSIKKCVEFLRKNENYNVCTGEVGLYNLDRRGVIVFPRYGRAYKGAIVEDFESDSAPARLRFNFSKCFMGINHSVCRTKDVKDLHSFIYSNDDIKNIAVLDRLFNSYMSFKGNIKTLPLMYQLRRQGNSLIHNKSIMKEVIPKNQSADWTQNVTNHIKTIHKLFAPEISCDDLYNILKHSHATGYYGGKSIRDIKTNIGPTVAKELGSIFNVQFKV